MASSSDGLGLGRVAIALLVWLGAIAGAVAVSTAVANSVHTTPGTTASRTSVSSTSTPSAPRPPFDPSSIKPTDPSSLFRTVNFARVLRTARARFGPRADIESLRLAPGEAQLTIVTQGQRRSVGIRANGDYLTFFTRPLDGPTQVFTLAQVHANVPAALSRRIAAHGGVPVSQLEYMLIRIDPVAHHFSWLVYRTGGDVHFLSDGAGSPITEYGSRGVHTLRG